MNDSFRYYDDEGIRELIRRYKQNDCLWNYNNPNYKNKALKQKIWKEMSKYFGRDVKEVKRKVKNLRSAYMMEKRKAIKSGNKANTHKPSLFYYDELRFLDKIVVFRKYGKDAERFNEEFENATVSQDSEYNDENVDFESEEEIDLKDAQVNCKIETFEEYEPEMPLSPQIPVIKPPRIVTSRSLASRPVKRKNSVEIQDNNPVISRTLSDSPNQNDQYKNVYISFGKTIGLQLQHLPADMAILAMSEIQTILTKTLLEHIKSPQKVQESSDSDYSCNELIEETFNDSSS